ncbi:MAG: DinB family protein [Candidatus Eisenbacteria bacterium]
MPWIERRFAFDTPVSLFPPLLERLRGTPARIEERVRDLPPEMLRRREADTWSIQENAGHLLEVERLWHGRLDDYEAGCQVLRAADMENRRTRDADYTRRAMEEILVAFRDSRMRLVARLETLDAAAVERTATHPRLNRPMRIVDLVLFAAEHDDHHLTRMTELVRAFARG